MLTASALATNKQQQTESASKSPSVSNTHEVQSFFSRLQDIPRYLVVFANTAL